MKPDPNFLFNSERRKMDYLLLRVCEHYQLRPADVIESRSRRALIARARHLAMYALRIQLGYSYPAIGCYFNRDHTSAIHGVRRVSTDVRMMSEYATIFLGEKVGDKMGISVDKPYKKLLITDLSESDSKVIPSLSTPYQNYL